VSVVLSNGNGTFAAPETFSVGASPVGVAVGDFKVGGVLTSVAAGQFSGNGKTDLVVGATSSLSVLMSNGDRTFTVKTTVPFSFRYAGLQFPVAVRSVAVSDLRGDGTQDIVALTDTSRSSLLGAATSPVSVLLGNGDGAFAAPVGVNTGSSSVASMVVGDFNGDGKLDLAATDFLGGDVSVLINTSPAAGATTPVATTTSLTADAGAAVFGQPVTLTATVTAASGAPTGAVTFYDGDTVLGEVALDPNGHASLVVQPGVGLHSLKASFAGVGGFTGSAATLSETVTRAATTTSLAGGATSFPGGQIVLLTATITPVAPGAGVPTGTVTFFEAGNVVGTAQVDGNGQASLTLYTLTRGKHTLTASYGGDANFQASASDALVVNV
jgi:hypothetical protein